MRRVFIVLTLVLLLLFSCFLWFSLRFFVFSSVTQPITLIIPPEANLVRVSAILSRQGVVRDQRYFVLIAKLRHQLHHLRYGEYLIKSGATPDQIMKQLDQGKVLLHKITLVEGWNFGQILHALAYNPALTHTLHSEDSPEMIMRLIGHSEKKAEGSFYPDTYLFSLGTKDTKILQMSYQLMQKKLNTAWKARASGLPYMDAEQALIVASMIEKESAAQQERPLIASVILNRLGLGMRLQIDATVIYGLGESYTGRLTHDNIRQDTPYNTYTRFGLPPTPIAMPSVSAIHAALHPLSSHFLYYVAKGDGTHVFTENLQAHHAAVQRYLLPRIHARSFRQQGALCISAVLFQNWWVLQ